MIEGDLNNLVRLDEQNNIKRQKQLYNSHLKFDPERPIYQHPLNLNNYIDLNNQAIFQQTVKNLLLSHFSQQQRRLCEEYDSAQRQLDSIGHGYMNDLQAQQTNQNNALKLEIVEQQKQIQRLHQQNFYKNQQNQAARIQIQQYKNFVHLHKELLQKIEFTQKHYQKMDNKFDDAKNELQQKSSSLLDKFQTQYNTIVFQKTQLQKAINEQNEVKSKKHQLENQMSTIRKMTLQMEDEIDIVKEEIARQTKSHAQATSRLQSSKLSSKQDEDASSRRSNARNMHTSIKPFTHIVKEKPNFCCPIILVAATLLLTILTVFQLFL